MFKSGRKTATEGFWEIVWDNLFWCMTSLTSACRRHWARYLIQVDNEHWTSNREPSPEWKINNLNNWTLLFRKTDQVFHSERHFKGPFQLDTWDQTVGHASLISSICALRPLLKIHTDTHTCSRAPTPALSADRVSTQSHIINFNLTWKGESKLHEYFER